VYRRDQNAVPRMVTSKLPRARKSREHRWPQWRLPVPITHSKADPIGGNSLSPPRQDSSDNLASCFPLAEGFLDHLRNYCSAAYSTVACLKMGMLESASFQRAKNRP